MNSFEVKVEFRAYQLILSFGISSPLASFSQFIKYLVEIIYRFNIVMNLWIYISENWSTRLVFQNNLQLAELAQDLIPRSCDVLNVGDIKIQIFRFQIISNIYPRKIPKLDVINVAFRFFAPSLNFGQYSNIIFSNSMK